jgi:hypothetical protein
MPRHGQEFVFVNTRRRKMAGVLAQRPIETMNNTAWQSARRRADLVQVRVHDLKPSAGGYAGVSFEDRQDFLGHKSGRITTHLLCC